MSRLFQQKFFHFRPEVVCGFLLCYVHNIYRSICLVIIRHLHQFIYFIYIIGIIHKHSRVWYYDNIVNGVVSTSVGAISNGNFRRLRRNFPIYTQTKNPETTTSYILPFYTGYYVYYLICILFMSIYYRIIYTDRKYCKIYLYRIYFHSYQNSILNGNIIKSI